MKKGSITVETTLALPLFLIFCMQLFSLFEILSVYCRMEIVAEEVAEEAAVYWYAAGEVRSGREAAIKTYVTEEIIRKAEAKRLNEAVVADGVRGITVSGAELFQDGDTVNLVLTYRVIPWFSIWGFGEMKMENHCRMKAWTGYDRTVDSLLEDTAQTVYITKSGTAYHLYRDCTYLRAGIRTVKRTETEGLRNCEGCRYYPCELCCVKEGYQENDTVVITPYGTRYHENPYCKALFKDVIEISIDEVNGRHLCTKCEKRRTEKGSDR